MRIGFLGPRGTFTEEAATRYYQGQDVVLTPFPSIVAVMDAVMDGRVDRGVVPIENSIEGSVTLTLDGLLENPDLFVEGGMVLPVEQNLIGLPGAKKADLREVWSHPQAIAQCRRYLRELGVEVKTFDSTAAAAMALARDRRPEVGVIAPALSARTFSLDILERGIQDYQPNHTRFGVLRRGPAADPRADKTMLLITPCEEHYGVLASLLNVLAAFRLNLTWIESRPTRRRLGTYQFLLDVDGGIHEEAVAKAISVIETIGHDVRVLGSYRTVAL
ncbi:prephenate dehydratase [Alicyclobacillus macrosporangiidus]|uniref:Prephenate dehydratase n=1 Tax=Alicyclobacillus macrosporangiidus TaxID=392015 RepID=A0A1I7L7X5_9BACL|nr:prephenate dehydratase [Alicyclobacillus macrosporangiidus]SFV05636.1 prephenate dehydratase [Alicyclobacillus macrosporangiidus]